MDLETNANIYALQLLIQRLLLAHINNYSDPKKELDSLFEKLNQQTDRAIIGAEDPRWRAYDAAVQAKVLDLFRRVQQLLDHQDQSPQQ